MRPRRLPATLMLGLVFSMPSDPTPPAPQPPAASVTEHTEIPTTEPTTLTTEPTHVPTTEPTTEPTHEPITQPTHEPTTQPTHDPTTEPTHAPTHDPTTEPTHDDPTQAPTHDDPTPTATGRPAQTQGPQPVSTDTAPTPPNITRQATTRAAKTKHVPGTTPGHSDPTTPAPHTTKPRELHSQEGFGGIHREIEQIRDSPWVTFGWTVVGVLGTGILGILGWMYAIYYRRRHH